MELVSFTPALMFALVGWSASVIAVWDSTQFTLLQKRLLLVFVWLLWMIPAFDSLVHRGLLQADAAVTFGGVLTALVVIFVSLSAIRWHSKW